MSDVTTATPLMTAEEFCDWVHRPEKVTRRITEYLRAGIRLIWLIDPEARDVTVYQPGKNSEVLEANQELTGGEVLPEFRCRVADIFFVAGEETP
jgi:Uma2 family endonuclease